MLWGWAARWQRWKQACSGVTAAGIWASDGSDDGESVQILHILRKYVFIYLFDRDGSGERDPIDRGLARAKLELHAGVENSFWWQKPNYLDPLYCLLGSALAGIWRQESHPGSVVCGTGISANPLTIRPNILPGSRFLEDRTSKSFWRLGVGCKLKTGVHNLRAKEQSVQMARWSSHCLEQSGGSRSCTRTT